MTEKCLDCYQFAHLDDLEPRERQLGGYRHRAGIGCRKDETILADGVLVVGSGRTMFKNLVIGVGTPVRIEYPDGSAGTLAWFYDGAVADEFVQGMKQLAELKAQLAEAQAEAEPGTEP